MEILHFADEKSPALLTDTAQIPEDGLVWVDFVRDDAQLWDCWAEPLIGVPIEPQHVADSLNASHRSFFDGTVDYDMLVFQGLGPKDVPFPQEPRPAAFFMF